jgi:integral membrane sensor domain MASE1
MGRRGAKEAARVTPVVRDRLTWGLWNLALAGGYYVAAELGLQLALVRGQITPLWPPTGIALACLLVHGRRCWPGIALGAFLVNLPLGPSLPAVLVITAGNTAAPVLACLLLERVGFHHGMDRLKDAVSLVFVGAFGGMLISATVGAGTLWLSDALPPGGFWAAWSVWWTGDAMGVLVVTPTLLVISRIRWRERVPVLRLIEAVGLPLAIAGVLVLANQSRMPLFFLAFPLLVWAAVRFQLRGAAPCALLMSLAAAYGAAEGIGPFSRLGMLEKMVALQAFNASTALTALLLAAITTQRNDAQHTVERAVVQLTDAVASLEPYSLLRDGRLENVLRARAARDKQIS